MSESSEYVSAFVNQDKYPRPVLKPRDELPAEPGDRTVILTTRDNHAFQRFDDAWHGQASDYYGYRWPEVMHYHGEDFIVLWDPERDGNPGRTQLLGPLLEHHPSNPDRTRIMRDGEWVKP